jgi:hypothetical protein
MKNSIDTIRNRTCDLPACSAVSEPTVPPCAPYSWEDYMKIDLQEIGWMGVDGVDVVQIVGCCDRTVNLQIS